MVNQTEVELQAQLIQEHLKKLESAEKNFIPFVRHVWPDFISGYHHRKIAKKFEDIRDGKIKRLIVNMPPRHTKSTKLRYPRTVKRLAVGKQTKAASTLQRALVQVSRAVVQTY